MKQEREKGKTSGVTGAMRSHHYRVLFADQL
jgi:hypothetical protein